MTKNRKQNEDSFSARFCSSGKATGSRRAQAYCSTSSIGDGPRTQPGCKIAAKNRRRTEILRGRAVRQACPERSRRKQRCNHPKEPPKMKVCENCRSSKAVWGLKDPTLICENKAEAPKKCIVVKEDEACGNFEYSRDIVSPENAAALAEGAKLIPLTQDKFAIVDAEDYESLSKHKWHVSKSHTSEYAVRCSGRKRISMHRLLLNAPPGLLVDHRDRNSLNNRKGNLRLCTHKENSRNSRPRPGGASKYKGVSWHKRDKKFIAQIVVDGKRHCLGYFADQIEAAVAYDIKAMVFFGEFAYFNFPDLMQRYKLVNSGPASHKSAKD